jgi:hypothetical protein
MLSFHDPLDLRGGPVRFSFFSAAASSNTSGGVRG